MTAPTPPRTIADLDVSVDVLVAAMAATHSESDRIAYSLDRELLAHPEACSTDADYPNWVLGKGTAQRTEASMTAGQWNARFPVGTPVVAYPGVRPEEFPKTAKRLVTVTRTPAWTLGHGEPVVSVEGYAGGIALTHVDVIEEVAR